MIHQDLLVYGVVCRFLSYLVGLFLLGLGVLVMYLVGWWYDFVFKGGLSTGGGGGWVLIWVLFTLLLVTLYGL